MIKNSFATIKVPLVSPLLFDKDKQLDSVKTFDIQGISFVSKFTL